MTHLYNNSYEYLVKLRKSLLFYILYIICSRLLKLCLNNSTPAVRLMSQEVRAALN